MFYYSIGSSYLLLPYTVKIPCNYFAGILSLLPA
nr:MAG TPA: hypothetical protein [Caudoviricetes sp.]